MQYTFEILGVSPVLHFFHHQQDILERSPHQGVEYVGTHKCTLDALLNCVETVPEKRGWNLDEVVDSVVSFWLNNSERVEHWRSRLNDAGHENLLVARVADLESLQTTFESIFGTNG